MLSPDITEATVAELKDAMRMSVNALCCELTKPDGPDEQPLGFILQLIRSITMEARRRGDPSTRPPAATAAETN